MIASIGIANAGENSFAAYRMLKPEIALSAAQAALNACREKGYQVAVSVTDRSGTVQVLLQHQPSLHQALCWYGHTGCGYSGARLLRQLPPAEFLHHPLHCPARLWLVRYSGDAHNGRRHSQKNA
jgi:hypothetical protein